MFAIKYIELAFENVEVIKIDGEHIGMIAFDDIRKIACNRGVNSFDIWERADTFALEIHRDANVERELNKNEHIFERIVRDNDIVSVEICDDMDDIHEFYVKWHKEDETKNRFQKSKIASNGNLYVVISEDEGLEVFDEKVLSGNAPWVWDRYDWGAEE